MFSTARTNMTLTASFGVPQFRPHNRVTRSGLLHAPAAGYSNGNSVSVRLCLHLGSLSTSSTTTSNTSATGSLAQRQRTRYSPRFRRQYTRKASTNSQLDDALPAKKTNKVVRTNSNRSWAVRAELTSTTTTAPSNSDGHPVPCIICTLQWKNWKCLKLNRCVKVKGQTKVENQTLPRDRVGTLERVPENTLMMKIPTSGFEPDQDDGYLGPSVAPKVTTSYLHLPVTLSPDLSNARFGSVSSTGSCDGGYHNFTVVGRVDLV
ncbi:uncharacterized protein LOC124263942 [Haliotis rubra]|uniref:uncharacterized protein LOC124263942 n=1 Tax=Haliotis rubra TaxID=36100 RepID=UPI001EE59CCD|nr:uncharacterized protein LOC124263942 [Haliotis rubra]